jgi:hypothetical protein
LSLSRAKVVRDCYESSSIYEHPYLCVIAQFDPIDASNIPIEVELEYEYVSENLLRKRDKPFQTKEEENVIVWIYDNNKQDSQVDLLNLSIKFENQIGEKKIVAYPEKYLLKNQTDSQTFLINWTVKDFKSHSYKNFALNIPLFNGDCQGMVKLFKVE